MNKREELEKVFSEMFTDYERIERVVDHRLDSTGRSKVYLLKFLFESGDSAQLHCYDFEEELKTKNNWANGLSVILRKKELTAWLVN